MNLCRDSLSTLLLVIFGVQILSLHPQAAVARSKILLLIASALAAGAIRYEAVFAIVPLSLLLLLRRRTGLAFLLAGCSAIGPFGFGLYSHHLSGFWLPFSVMVKATQAHPYTLVEWLRILSTLGEHSGFRQMLEILLVLWILRAHTRRFWDPSQLLLFFSFVIAFTHLLVAVTGWLLRYESYFVTLFLFAISVCAALLPRPFHIYKEFLALRPMRRVLAMLLLVFSLWLSPHLFVRAVLHGTLDTVRAAVDRYDEHIQIARFITGAYDHDTIVLDDIGAVAYYSDAHILDVIGLGSVEPVRALRAGHPFTAADVALWASSQHASIAVLQTGSPNIARLTPVSWTLVEDWRLPRNVVFGDYDVAFYAVNSATVAHLCESLARFNLPPKVEARPVPGACPANPGSESALRRMSDSSLSRSKNGMSF